MAIGALDVGTYKQISATANIKADQGAVLAIICSSSTAGTVTIYNSATTTTTDKIVDTMSIAAGTRYTINAAFNLGLYIVIGGTASLTVTYI